MRNPWKNAVIFVIILFIKRVDNFKGGAGILLFSKHLIKWQETLSRDMVMVNEISKNEEEGRDNDSVSVYVADVYNREYCEITTSISLWIV